MQSVADGATGGFSPLVAIRKAFGWSLVMMVPFAV